ncbi:hypothetical protein DSBG_3422 [Desulfosporosinus sp. BG]|nr:hypothetical protein DSBG_3422 [Desulfosporosinus sp. BG]
MKLALCNKGGTAEGFFRPLIRMREAFFALIDAIPLKCSLTGDAECEYMGMI